MKGYKCPTDGEALLWMQGMDVPQECSYNIEFAEVEADDYIIFSDDGWEFFRTHANILKDSLLLIKVEARVDAIGLDFVENIFV